MESYQFQNVNQLFGLFIPEIWQRFCGLPVSEQIPIVHP